MAFLKRLLRALPLLLLSPFLLAFSFVCAASAAQLFTRAASRCRRRRRPRNRRRHRRHSQLERPRPAGEVPARRRARRWPAIRTTKSSWWTTAPTDGSADFLREHFPQVTLLALPQNLGFGGGSNAGFRAAKNDIVVLLNSDMRVAPRFSARRCSKASTTPRSSPSPARSSSAIPDKLREETGLTQGWWQDGTLRVRHRIDPAGHRPLPLLLRRRRISCAFDRDKFLELGGFDPLLAPFYLEDTDLGYMAWKRGWKVLYQPRSVVFHEHRGTIGKKFSQELHPGRAQEELPPVLLEEHPRAGRAWSRTSSSPGPARCWRAVRRRARAPQSGRRCGGPSGNCRRRCARAGARVSLAAIERYRSLPPSAGRLLPRPLRSHGAGARSACACSSFRPTRSARRCTAAASSCTRRCARWRSSPRSTWWNCWTGRSRRRPTTSCATSAPPPSGWCARSGRTDGMGSHRSRTRCANSPTTIWSGCIHRQMYTRTDRRAAARIHAHGAVRRQLPPHRHRAVRARRLLPVHRPRARPHDRRWPAKSRRASSTCAPCATNSACCPASTRCRSARPANREYLLGFLPELAPRMQRRTARRHRHRALPASGRAGASRMTMLFLGSLAPRPQSRGAGLVRAPRAAAGAGRGAARAQLVVVGSDPPPEHTYADYAAHMEMLGYVEDVREPLARYAVFVCPILSGSGVRVKLLEAFAAGIPVVSTRVGAEGLAVKDGEFCALADDPARVRRARRGAVARSRARRGHGRTRAPRSRSGVGYGRDHAPAGGKLSRAGKGKR